MSRAEERTLPPSPRLVGVLRLAGADLYYHGVRLVIANLAWGLAAILTAYAATRSPIGLLMLVPMIPLSVGLMGMATTLVRERHLVMSDFARAVRAGSWRLLGLGLAQIGVVGVAVFDLLLGLRIGGPVGLVLAVTAFYTMLAVWLLAITVWPIVTDPERRGEPIRAGIRLGAILLVAHPLRILGLGIVIGAVTVAATVLVAAIVTFAAAYLALVAAHFVLPAADRLEGRATALIEES